MKLQNAINSKGIYFIKPIDVQSQSTYQPKHQRTTANGEAQ